MSVGPVCLRRNEPLSDRLPRELALPAILSTIKGLSSPPRSFVQESKNWWPNSASEPSVRVGLAIIERLWRNSKGNICVEADCA